jgi:hypothetical protein
MERPGFNPQALARRPGCQRSGANKDEKKAAQRAYRRWDAGVGGKNDGLRSCHEESLASWA